MMRDYSYRYRPGSQGGAGGGGPSAQEALAALMAGKANSGMYDMRATTDSGTLTVPNIAGGLPSLLQVTAANKPAINATTGLLFDGSNDRVDCLTPAAAYTIDLLMRKTAGSTNGHIIAGLRLYTEASATGSAGTTVDGVAATTRGALFTALNDAAWHHVRFTGLSLATALALGQTAAGMAANVIICNAINEVEFSGADLTAARDASAAWIAEQTP